MTSPSVVRQEFTASDRAQLQTKLTQLAQKIQAGNAPEIEHIEPALITLLSRAAAGKYDSMRTVPTVNMLERIVNDELAGVSNAQARVNIIGYLKADGNLSYINKNFGSLSTEASSTESDPKAPPLPPKASERERAIATAAWTQGEEYNLKAVAPKPPAVRITDDYEPENYEFEPQQALSTTVQSSVGEENPYTYSNLETSTEDDGKTTYAALNFPPATSEQIESETDYGIHHTELAFGNNPIPQRFDSVYEELPLRKPQDASTDYEPAPTGRPPLAEQKLYSGALPEDPTYSNLRAAEPIVRNLSISVALPQQHRVGEEEIEAEEEHTYVNNTEARNALLTDDDQPSTTPAATQRQSRPNAVIRFFRWITGRSNTTRTARIATEPTHKIK